MFKLIRVAVTAALLVVPALGFARSSPADDKPADDRGHGPHPEAIAACKDKSEGDACEFDAPHGHVAGMCHKDHAGDLACFHPHMHHDGGA
jgi:hypothetical protein